MKAVCIKAGAHRQWEVGRVYNVFGCTGGEVFFSSRGSNGSFKEKTFHIISNG